MLLSDCSYIMASHCRKRNLISDLSDLLLDATDLILVVGAGPLMIGVFGLFQTSDQTLYLCLCGDWHVLIYCRC